MEAEDVAAPVTLPRLAFIADRFTHPGPFETALRIVMEDAVPWIHLRDHEADEENFLLCARELVDLARSQDSQVCFSMNTRGHVARELDAEVHATHLGPSPDVARRMLGPERIIGFSAHENADLSSNVARNVNYLFFSPVFDPGSKPGKKGVGIGALESFCRKAGAIPVFALGGITPGRISPCVEAGAYGVAVVTGILAAEDPVAAAEAYMRQLR
jgi:thiamine-phosphate pyrophosphorylase